MYDIIDNSQEKGLVDKILGDFLWIFTIALANTSSISNFQNLQTRDSDWKDIKLYMQHMQREFNSCYPPTALVRNLICQYYFQSVQNVDYTLQIRADCRLWVQWGL